MQLLWNAVPHLLPTDGKLEIPGYALERVFTESLKYNYRVGGVLFIKVYKNLLLAGIQWMTQQHF